MMDSDQTLHDIQVTHLGIEFKDSEGKRILVHPQEIRFVEEIADSTLQITTTRWIKTYNRVKYEDVVAAIEAFETKYQSLVIRPWQDLVTRTVAAAAKLRGGE